MSEEPRSALSDLRSGVPPLRALDPDGVEDAVAWLRASLTTFARNVGSFLPGGFDAYARLYHPIGAPRGSVMSGPTPSWHARATTSGVSHDDPWSLTMLQESVRTTASVECGSLPPTVLVALVEHLRGATTTPEQCFFAVWEGWGDSVFPASSPPMLVLPCRGYHVFSGPVESAMTSLSAIPFHRSANLWWPSDHAWCIASEIDLAWTYVGGARRDIDALLADQRLDISPTTASAER